MADDGLMADVVAAAAAAVSKSSVVVVDFVVFGVLAKRIQSHNPKLLNFIRARRNSEKTQTHHATQHTRQNYLCARASEPLSGKHYHSSINSFTNEFTTLTTGRGCVRVMCLMFYVFSVRFPFSGPQFVGLHSDRKNTIGFAGGVRNTHNVSTGMNICKKKPQLKSEI